MSGQLDFEIVGETSDDASLTDEVERTRPDYLIVSMDSQVRPALCGFLLGRFPNMRILALTSDGGGVQHYWAQLTLKTERVSASPDTILNVMRGAVEADSDADLVNT